MKHPHKKTIKQTCVSAKSGDSTAPGTTTSTTVFSLYTGGSVMLCVNGEQLFHSAVLLLVLRCIHVAHHIGESVLRDNSKVTFHRPPCFGGKGTIKICQTAYYELKRISSTRRYLTADAAKQLVTSCVLSRLDYCNSLLMGTPNSVTTASTTVFSSYTGVSVMLCVNGEPLFHSVVLLLVYIASV